MNKNQIYKILLEEVLNEEKVKFNIFPYNVDNVAIIPKHIALYEIDSKVLEITNSCEAIKMQDFGFIVEIPDFIAEDYEEAFLRISIRKHIYNELVKQAYETLSDFDYSTIRGFISGKVFLYQNNNNQSQLIKFNGKIAIYGE